MRPFVLLVELLLVSWVASAADSTGVVLPPHRAKYLVTRDALPIATVEMELQLQPDRGYLYRSTMRPEGALAFLAGMALDIAAGARITEVSAGRVDAEGFHPQHYRYRRDNDDTRELTVTFDRVKGRADMDSQQKPWSMPVPPEAVDKLSVLLALRNDLAAGKPVLSYPVADGGKLKTYAYSTVGEREVSTPAGVWECLEVERVKEGGPPDYRLWLSPALSYLPVRVDREEGGSLFRMELTAVDGLGRGAPDPSGG